jgi:hypothetical protein
LPARAAAREIFEGSWLETEPGAAEKCQSSGLRHFGSSHPVLLTRAAFVIAFFGLELVGIAWGQRTPDHALGFQMFNETSHLTIHLFREVEGQRTRMLVPVPNGQWQAPDASGKLRDYAWRDRVHYSPLKVLERRVPARYGLAGQLFHLQAALDDMVRHIPDDTSTLALVAKVDTLRNGVPGPQRQFRADKP